MTQHALARQLKKFETGDHTPIAPGSIRIGDNTSKGYLRSQFDDAFRRYLLPGGELSKPSQRHNANEMGASCTSQPVTPDPNVTVGKCEKANHDGHCDGVTVEKGHDGASEVPARICNHCGLAATQANPLSPWEWEGWPDGIWLHPRCEEAWHNSETGRAITDDKRISR